MKIVFHNVKYSIILFFLLLYFGVKLAFLFSLYIFSHSSHVQILTDQKAVNLNVWKEIEGMFNKNNARIFLKFFIKSDIFQVSQFGK